MGKIPAKRRLICCLLQMTLLVFALHPARSEAQNPIIPSVPDDARWLHESELTGSKSTSSKIRQSNESSNSTIGRRVQFGGPMPSVPSHFGHKLGKGSQGFEAENTSNVKRDTEPLANAPRSQSSAGAAAAIDSERSNIAFDPFKSVNVNRYPFRSDANPGLMPTRDPEPTSGSNRYAWQRADVQSSPSPPEGNLNRSAIASTNTWVPSWVATEVPGILDTAAEPTMKSYQNAEVEAAKNHSILRDATQADLTETVSGFHPPPIRRAVVALQSSRQGKTQLMDEHEPAVVPFHLASGPGDIPVNQSAPLPFVPQRSGVIEEVQLPQPRGLRLQSENSGAIVEQAESFSSSIFDRQDSGLPTVPPFSGDARDNSSFDLDPKRWIDKSSTGSQMSIEEVGRQIANGRIATERQPVTIGLHEILALALQNSKNINVLRIQPAEALQNVNREFGQFDWTGFVETLFSQDAQPVGNVGQTSLAIDQVRNDQNSVEVGLRKQTLYGGQVSVSEVLGTADTNSGLLDPEEPGNARLRVTFSQELLRDRGRDVVLSQALIASLNADISHAESFAAISDLLRDVLRQYWDLYQRRGDYFIQLSLIRWAEETLSLLESRGKIDAEQNSIEQARALLLEARANLENAKASVLISQDELYRLVNAKEIDSNFVEILTVEPPQKMTDDFQVLAELQEALTSRAEISQKLLEIRTAAIAHHVSLNQLLPRLTLSLESSLNGIDDDRDVFGAFSNMVDVDPSYAAGVNFEIFLGNRAARAQNKQAQLALRRLQFEYEDEIEQVRLDVATAIRTLNASTAILQQRYRTLQARMEEIEYLRLRRDVIPQQGVSPSLLLEQFFQAINRLVVSQQAYVAAVRDQQSALADLLQAKGVLLDTSDVPKDILVAVPSLRRARREQREGSSKYISESQQRVVRPGRTTRLPTKW